MTALDLSPLTPHPPVSGRKALFVNRIFTTRIVQLKPHDSDALLALLFAHLEMPEFQCRFRWQPGSVASPSTASVPFTAPELRTA